MSDTGADLTVSRGVVNSNADLTVSRGVVNSNASKSSEQ